MTTWTNALPGQDTTGEEKPVLVFQAGADINSVYAGMKAQLLSQQVHYASALGWSLTELLGRCFLLQDTPASEGDWSGAQIVGLPESLSAREAIRALMEHILFLAANLNVRTITIDDEGDPDKGQFYADVIKAQVIQLCEGRFDASKNETRQSVFGDMNHRLYFWDLVIQDSLQNAPLVIHRAYLTGHSLGAMRWYFPSKQGILSQDMLNKVCHEYIPILSPYIYPFAPGAISNSVELWGQALAAGKVQPENGSFAPQELHDQAHIWYDLMTGARNPLTFAGGDVHGTRFVWKLIRVAWPLYAMHVFVLLLVLAVIVVIVVLNYNLVLTGITAVAGFLALAGTSHSAFSNIGGLLQGAATRAEGTIKGSLVDSLWHSTQQTNINNATYIPPVGMKPPTK
jgi:hypothetical protein